MPTDPEAAAVPLLHLPRARNRVLLCSLAGCSYREAAPPAERSLFGYLAELGYLGSSPLQPGMSGVILFVFYS